MKTTLIKSCILCLVLTPGLVLASSPTIDPATTAVTGADVATNATTTSQEILQVVKDYGLDQIAYTLAQKLGQKMATASINKATGGASKDNDPNFIKDFGSIMSNIEQQQRDLYTTKLLTSVNPYARNIAQQMIKGPGNPLNNFTLGSVLSSGGDWQEVGNNLALAGKDSLVFYSQLGLPQNTPTGARLLADNALSKQTLAKKESEALKITSSGFLPNTKCNVKISDYKNNVQSIIQNEQQNAANGTTITQNNNLINTNNSIANGSYVPDSAVDPEDPVVTETSTPLTNTQLNNQNTQLQNQSTANSFDTAGNIQGLTQDTAGCIEEMIKNPVATTQVLTNEAGKFGMDMTKNISGWGQIVAGLFVSLFNGFVEKGLSSLSADYGQVKKSNVGGPEQLVSNNANGTTNFANTPVNIVNLREDFDQALIDTERNIETLKNIKEVLLLVPARLAVLDIMLPGPDFIGLNTRLDKYYDHQTAWLQKNSVVGSDDNRNAYEENILAYLNREYDIARNETIRDMNDDTRNIPGAGAMRTAINSFTTKKQKMQSANDNFDSSSNTLIELRQINVGLKKNIDWLRNNNTADFATLPTIVFSQAEWTSLTQAQKDESYAWAVSHATSTPIIDAETGEIIGQTQLTGLGPNQQRDLVIEKSWDLWENPALFTTGTTWTPELNTSFLAEKNSVRVQFSNIRGSIPSDWEISKNEQEYASHVADIARIDNLIRDADKMRELIAGDGSGGSWYDQNPGGSPTDLLAYMITNKETLFRSDEVKSALTLPNILNTPRTWEDDGCRPGTLHANPSAQYPSAQTGAEHVDGYSCYGNFGYTLSGIKYGSHEFNVWIDEDSNQYQSQPHFTKPDQLYWKSRIVKAVPPPEPDTYKKGWTIQELRDPDGFMETPDGGLARYVFCRLSSVSAVYGRFSGYALDHNAKNMYCSSKWADVSVADSIGLFLVNQLR